MAKLELKREIVIKYRWWRGAGVPVRPDDVEELERTAEHQIFKMLQDGYVCGDLSTWIAKTPELTCRMLDYTGYWEVKREAS